MVGIQQARRDQEQPGFGAQAVGEFALDVQLFDFRLTRIRCRGYRVLPLELGDQPGVVVEAMLQADHGPAHVGLRLARIPARAVVVDFAIAGEDGLRALRCARG